MSGRGIRPRPKLIEPGYDTFSAPGLGEASSESCETNSLFMEIDSKRHDDLEQSDDSSEDSKPNETESSICLMTKEFRGSSFSIAEED